MEESRPQTPRVPDADSEGRAKVIAVIQHPLAYFALALLILEGFMGWGLHEVKPDDKIVVFWGLVAVLVLLVGLVGYLAIFRPQNLTNAGIVKDIQDLRKELEEARADMDRITRGINSTAMDDFVREIVIDEWQAQRRPRVRLRQRKLKDLSPPK